MPAKPKTADRRDIELRAYLIWENEGRPHGREVEHWHRAEAEILGAVKKKAPAKKKAVVKPVLKAVPPADKPAAKAPVKPAAKPARKTKSKKA